MKIRTALFLLLAFASVGKAEIRGLITPPAGANGEVQFNKKNSFGSDPTFTYSTATKTLTVSTLSVTNISISSFSVSTLQVTGLDPGILMVVGTSSQMVTNAVSLSTQVTGTVSLSTQTNSLLSLSTQTTGNLPIGQLSSSNTLVSYSSASSAYTHLSSAIYNSSTLQSGAKFNVASGTVGELHASTITGNVANVLNVKTYGATGDGITNDRVFIQSAIDQAAFNGGGVIYFPPGVYITTASIIAKSSVTFVGAGKYLSVISLPQSDITTMNYSLIQNSDNLSKFSIKSLGLRGNRSFQTTSFTSSSEDGMAVGLFTGRLSDISFDDLYIYEFGAIGAAKLSGGGGIVIVPTGTNTTCNNITLTNSIFGNNDKVPGFYLDPQNGSGGGGGRNIIVKGNSFLGGGNNNTVYVLGGYGANESKRVYNVDISNNLFYTTESHDASVEINGTWGFNIDNNIFHYTASAVANPALIRSGVANGSFSGNSIVSLSTETTKPSVALVAFNSGEYQDNIVIDGNTFFTSTAAVDVLKIQKGSRNIVVSNNVFMSSVTTMSRAVAVGEATDINIINNHFENVATPIILSEGTFPVTARIGIKGNRFYNCGGSGAAHIATTGGTIAITELEIENNIVLSPKSTAGGATFATIAASASTGNVLKDNKVYGSLPLTGDGTDWTLLRGNAGSVTAYSSSYTYRSSPVTTVANTAKNVASVTLGIGDWQISGAVGWRTQANTTVFYAAINTTSNTLPGGDAFGAFENGSGIISLEDYVSSAAQDISLALPVSRVRVNSGTTTVYLIQQTDAANNTYGFIEATLK